MVKEHLPGYQARDYQVIDYQMYCLPGTNLFFRGPEANFLKTGEYAVCLGAAQTFGCFCDRPFPHLLQDKLGLPILNLGYGGAGPFFYLKHPELWDYINRAKFVIVQIMSARSESNSLFDSGGLEFLTRLSDGVKLGADKAYTTILESNYIWQKAPIGKRAVRVLARVFGGVRAMKLVLETRQNWLKNYELLFTEIKAPTILFWFSKRKPHYNIRPTNLGGLFNRFPQLVNAQMINVLKALSDDYVECVSSRGSPQKLISRFTGKPVTIKLSDDREDFGDIRWSHNGYYPSPDMHVDALRALEPFCRKYL
ncbi:MAG: DUF6473 family protein [Cyanobacteria bacterium P01_H01_bin.15]